MKRRRVGITKYMFLPPDDIYHDVSCGEGNNGNVLKRNDEDRRRNGPLYWVEGEIIRRFLSCSDGMEDVLCPPIGSRNTMLQNKQYLCEHGKGLNPRVAQRGKYLERDAYKTFLSLLLGERHLLLSQKKDDVVGIRKVTTTTTMEDNNVNFNDVVIYTGGNLYCPKCVKLYRHELDKKVENIKLLMELYIELDPGTEKVGDEGRGNYDNNSINNINVNMYIISKTFISNLRKYSIKLMKEVMNDVKVTTGSARDDNCIGNNKQVRRCVAVEVLEGIDSLDLKKVSLELGQSTSEANALDSLVNSNISCECPRSLFRFMRFYVRKS